MVTGYGPHNGSSIVAWCIFEYTNMAKGLEGLFLHFGTENVLGKHNAMSGTKLVPDTLELEAHIICLLLSNVLYRSPGLPE